jgi:hypothetical protein
MKTMTEIDKVTARLHYPEIFNKSALINPGVITAYNAFQKHRELLPEEYREYFNPNYEFDNPALDECWVLTVKKDLFVFGDGDLTCSNNLYILEM